MTSNGVPSTITVTVPWSMPVGTALKPAARARSITAPGIAVVAMSTSCGSLPEHGVAHGAADHARLLAGMVEHGEQLRERAGREPRGVWQVALHFIFPGTSCPFSICAGS